MIQIAIDGSVIIQIVNFLFLIWVLNIVLYKPIRKVLLQRKGKLTSLTQSIESFRREAAEREESFNLGIKDARAQGLKEKESLLHAASEEERKIIEKINEKTQADFAQIRERITQDVERVKKSLQKEIDGYANAIGQKILGRGV